MGIFSDNLKSGVVGESIRASSATRRTIAKVIDANENTNFCTIVYKDQSGSVTEMPQVAVDFRNTDWFPEKGDTVLIDMTRNSAVIVSRYTTDYASEVRSEEKLENDIMPDGDGTCVGGQIL